MVFDHTMPGPWLLQQSETASEAYSDAVPGGSSPRRLIRRPGVMRAFSSCPRGLDKPRSAEAAGCISRPRPASRRIERREEDASHRTGSMGSMRRANAAPLFAPPMSAPYRAANERAPIEPPMSASPIDPTTKPSCRADGRAAVWKWKQSGRPSAWQKTTLHARHVGARVLHATRKASRRCAGNPCITMRSARPGHALRRRCASGSILPISSSHAS